MKTDDTGKTRRFRRAVGLATLATGFIGLGTQSADATVTESFKASTDPLLSAKTDEGLAGYGLGLDAVRTSGNADAVIAYLRTNPDSAVAQNLIMTLPRAVAREVADALAQGQGDQRPAKAAVKAGEIQLAQTDVTITKNFGGRRDDDCLPGEGCFPLSNNPSKGSDTGGY